MLFFLFSIPFLYISLVDTNLQSVTNVDDKNVTLTTKIAVSNQSSNDESGPKQMGERSLSVIKANSSFNETNIKKFQDFIPSPLFNGYNNNFPLNQQSKSFDTLTTKNVAANSWSDNSRRREEESSIESPWKSTIIKFPAPTEARPYAFDYGHDRPPPVDLLYRQPSLQQHLPGQAQLQLPLQVQPQLPLQAQPQLPLQVEPYIYQTRGTNRPQESMWTKLLGFVGFDHAVSTPKSFIGDHSSYGANQISYGGSHFDHDSYSYHTAPKEHYHSFDTHGSGGMNPWKKVLKVIATIIPIGLLISALTPTIITVSSVNDTQNRLNRKDELSDSAMNKVANSLHSLQKLYQEGCEQKVFCELMVNAMFSNNAEEHIKNLLDNFVKGSGPNEVTFTKILEAVKNQDCSPIICKDMKDPT